MRQQNAKGRDLSGKSFALPDIRLLAQVTKTLLLALPMLVFAVDDAVAGFCSGPDGDMNDFRSKTNFVASIKVNELNWTYETTSQPLRQAFGKGGMVTGKYYVQGAFCVPYYDVTVKYTDKTIRFFSLYHEKKTKLTNIINNDETIVGEDGKTYPRRLILSGIKWDLRKFKDSLVVGNYAIKPDLTFESFKKLFPLSAQKNIASQYPGYGGAQEYIVGLDESESERPSCLDMGVVFTFSNGKLIGLALRNYEPVCGC